MTRAGPQRHRKKKVSVLYFSSSETLIVYFSSVLCVVPLHDACDPERFITISSAKFFPWQMNIRVFETCCI